MSARFGDLGRRVKAAYRSVAEDEGPSEDEVRDALATLMSAWDRLAGSIASSLRDPDTRDDLKAAAGSLAGALGSMLSHLGSEFDAASTTTEESGEEE